ncbi:uncharacterized protein LOC126746503 [Anthonomus grandis grandis]|uniref:uncharacterized protein LOC126746503 n=1 Tax=Anthonomus grandis grandis TaxID=2921223 RepID=UPI0021656431|nr:uncharacterized protein LOC126746503 [Anthonomus grandis grandis]
MEKGDEDNERLLEKCWREDYKGASRKWLIRDASGMVPRAPLCSTMKESYVYPTEKDDKPIGIRKKTLIKKLYEEATAEVLEEQAAHEEPNDYCTEYDGNFKIDNFQTDKAFYLKEPDLQLKYPLYNSPPASYYSFNQQKDPTGSRAVLHGLTRVTDVQNMFRRHDGFSKPISETFYAHEL